MKRRDTILALLALGAAARPSLALAQPVKPPRRIATLDDANETSRARGWSMFRKRLQELGYVEGKGYVIEARWSNAQTERLPALAAELVALKPDVIVAGTTTAGLAAKRATSSIPIVVFSGLDPVKAGLVSNFARPEGNVTGLSSVTTDIVGKSLELMREIAPKAKSFAVLMNTGAPAGLQYFREVQELARPHGLAVQLLDGRDRGNVQRAFETMARQRVDALIVGNAQVLVGQRQQIVEAAARQRIPAIYARREYAEAGGLMSYGADNDALFLRAADYVHRILQGAKPLDLPFERASVFRLVVNAKAVQALGLKIPESVRVRVDEVIQ